MSVDRGTTTIRCAYSLCRKPLPRAANPSQQKHACNDEHRQLAFWEKRIREDRRSRQPAKTHRKGGHTSITIEEKARLRHIEELARAIESVRYGGITPKRVELRRLLGLQ